MTKDKRAKDGRAMNARAKDAWTKSWDRWTLTLI